MDSLLNHWEYAAGSIPTHGAEAVRMNLWLMNGNPSKDGQVAEVIISNFSDARVDSINHSPDVQPQEFRVWQNFPP